MLTRFLLPVAATFLVGLLFANFAAAAGGDIGKCFRSLASCSGESRLVNGTLSSGQ